MNLKEGDLPIPIKFFEEEEIESNTNFVIYNTVGQEGSLSQSSTYNVKKRKLNEIFGYLAYSLPLSEKAHEDIINSSDWGQFNQAIKAEYKKLNKKFQKEGEPIRTSLFKTIQKEKEPPQKEKEPARVFIPSTVDPRHLDNTKVNFSRKFPSQIFQYLLRIVVEPAHMKLTSSNCLERVLYAKIFN